MMHICIFIETKSTLHLMRQTFQMLKAVFAARIAESAVATSAVVAGITTMISATPLKTATSLSHARIDTTQSTVAGSFDIY